MAETVVRRAEAMCVAEMEQLKIVEQAIVNKAPSVTLPRARAAAVAPADTSRRLWAESGR